MQYYVSTEGPLNGYGTKEMPFRKIGQAAEIARPGDEIIVMPGIYRETVDPKLGGEKDAPIIYRSAEPGKAVITGAEVIKGWEHLENDLWKISISNHALEWAWNQEYIKTTNGSPNRRRERRGNLIQN